MGERSISWSKSIRAEGEKYGEVFRNSSDQESVRYAVDEPVLGHAFYNTGTVTLQSHPSHQQINNQVSLCGCSQSWRRECLQWNSQISLTLNTVVARRYFESHQRHFDLLFGRTDLSRCFEPKCLNLSLLLNHKRSKILLLWARAGDLVDILLRRVCSPSPVLSNTAQL